MFKNKQYNFNLIVGIFFIMVILFSILTWFNARSWAGMVEQNELWYKEPIISRMERDFAYEQAFRKIVLVSGLAFSCVGLYIISKKKWMN